MYKAYETSLSNQSLSFREKFLGISFSYVLMITLLAMIGIVMLYSAANGRWFPWAAPQLMRFVLGFAVMIGLAFVDVRIFLRGAYLFYFAVLGLLILVEIGGHIGMGAQRWINLGFMKLQPSELMKIALVLALARYFNSTTLQGIESLKGLIIPGLMTLVPVALVSIQPDLGTALMLLFTAGAMFFAVGVQLWKFGIVLIGGVVSMPIAWHFLHTYQKNRVLTFLDPERDPLGAGYHIIQSKIALGSGGIFGKGFLNGTQSHLNFLPEKHTDFIFTMLSEEFGMIGAVMIIFLNLLIIAYSFIFALRSASYFGKLMAIGLTTSYFLYVIINISMVLGLLPVVGVPLPLISYGGTVIISVMAGFGIILAVNTNRNINIGKD
jgi:rod shape determining protein RodA